MDVSILDDYIHYCCSNAVAAAVVVVVVDCCDDDDYLNHYLMNARAVDFGDHSDRILLAHVAWDASQEV